MASIFEAEESIHRIGTSAICNPSRRAMNRFSTSNPKPWSVCRRKTSWAASRVNSLKPHCVSWIPPRAITRINKLITFPMAMRYVGWEISICEPTTAREPMAICTFPFKTGAASFSNSSMGVLRSASLNSTRFLLAFSIPETHSVAFSLVAVVPKDAHTSLPERLGYGYGPIPGSVIDCYDFMVVPVPRYIGQNTSSVTSRRISSLYAGIITLRSKGNCLVF